MKNSKLSQYLRTNISTTIDCYINNQIAILLNSEVNIDVRNPIWETCPDFWFDVENKLSSYNFNDKN